MNHIIKLKNKKTGEIYETTMPIVFNIKTIGGGEHTVSCESISELNEKWEDAPEEPKGHWTIGHDGAIFELSEWENQKDHEEIGNYFDSEEEAEKAVEKLKALKRLKDKGFRFNVAPALGHCDDKQFDISIMANMPIKWWYNDKVVDDIHYVFGGEE